MKNIVVCCDGTNNQLDGDLTNVVRLFEILCKDKEQVAYYDPGVGTMADPFARGYIGKRWSLIKGLAFGAGLDDNVLDAYRFLMRVYEPGDRIFLFGFSRGAFTVRVLAGMLHGVGLLNAETDNLVPYVWRTYRKIRQLLANATEREQQAAQSLAAEIALLRRSFTRPCPIAFLGPWDTVGSVGMYNFNESFAYTYENPSVAIVRHAVSLDERRAAFRSNVFKPDASPLPHGRPRVMNVWFPGVHCDVGGGYTWTADSSLAMLSFEWMVREAQQAGLLIDQGKLQALLDACPPDPCGTIHESLTGGWKLMEYLPARRYNWKSQRIEWRFSPNRPRTIADGCYLHQSVLGRMARQLDYRPASLPQPHSFPTEV